MYKTIVVGTDGSVTAGKAVTHAAQLAAATGATLHVVHAYALPDSAVANAAFVTVPVNTEEWTKAVHARADEIAAAGGAAARAAGATVEVHTAPGDPAEVLIDAAERVGADLLVVGNRGMSGVRRFVLGSVPNKVSHHCPCHLLILQTG